MLIAFSCTLKSSDGFDVADDNEYDAGGGAGTDAGWANMRRGEATTGGGGGGGIRAPEAEADSKQAIE